MSDTPNRIDAALLTRLLRSALGHCGNLTNYRIVREDEDYAVIAARLTDPIQEVVIKLAGPRAVLASAFERTAAIAQLVRSHSVVRTFDVLAVDVSYRIWPWRYIVTTTVPGDHWSDVCARGQATRPRALYASLGRTIGQLHTIHFPSCGEIAPDGSVTAGTTYYQALMERAQRRIANPAHAMLFVSLLQERSQLFNGLVAGTLCHDDLNPSNLLVAGTAADQPAVAVIDFDSAWAGCSESDLARLEFWRGMTGEGFWEAYQDYVPVSVSYPERRPIHQLLWCLEYARPTAQHITDTERVCTALGIAPVTFP